MTQPIHWYLKQVDLFHGISDKEIMKIAEKVVEKECRKKELLYTPFEDSESICILKKGEVTLYNSHQGKKLIIDVLTPGSLFGNLCLQEHKNTHFAEVTQDALICFFQVEDFLKIVEKKPELMVRFLHCMSERLHDYERKLKTGLYDAKEKIIHHLEQQKIRSSSFLGKLFRQERRLTHSQLAEFTGLTRETVTRAIRDLKKAGVIAESKEGLLLK